MSDLYGLPIITSPNLPEGTVLLLNPEWSVLTPPTLFETEALYNGCRSFSMMFEFKFNPRAFSMLGIDGPDWTAYWEPVKYRGLARVVHMLRKMLDKLRH